MVAPGALSAAVLQLAAALAVAYGMWVLRLRPERPTTTQTQRQPPDAGLDSRGQQVGVAMLVRCWRRSFSSHASRSSSQTAISCSRTEAAMRGAVAMVIVLPLLLAGCGESRSDPLVTFSANFELDSAPRGAFLRIDFELVDKPGTGIGVRYETDLRHPFDAMVVRDSNITRLALWPLTGNLGEVRFAGLPGSPDSEPNQPSQVTFGAFLEPGRYAFLLGYESLAAQRFALEIVGVQEGSLEWGNGTGYVYRDSERAADEPGEVFIGQGPSIFADQSSLPGEGVLYWAGAVAGGTLHSRLEGPDPKSWSVESPSRLEVANETESALLGPGTWTLETTGQWAEGAWFVSYVPMPRPTVGLASSNEAPAS